MTDRLHGHPSNVDAWSSDARLDDPPQRLNQMRSGWPTSGRLHTNHYCKRCGGVVSSGIEHMCQSEDQFYAQIARTEGLVPATDDVDQTALAIRDGICPLCGQPLLEDEINVRACFGCSVDLSGLPGWATDEWMNLPDDELFGALMQDPVIADWWDSIPGGAPIWQTDETEVDGDR